MRLFDGADAIVPEDSITLPRMLAFNRARGVSVFRKHVWEQCGGFATDFSKPGIEDWDFWLRMLEAGYHAAVLPEVVFEYRIRPGSMSDDMYDPDVWGPLVAELIDRHAAFYGVHFREVISDLNARWSRERRWIQDREDAIVWWQVRAEAEERSKQWFESQSVEWQRIAGEREALLDEQRRWIAELERAKQWHEEQSARWRAIAEGRTRINR